MFGKNDNWFSIPDDAFNSTNRNYGWIHDSPGYVRQEVRRQRNEMTTRDYFRGVYGTDPWDVGFEVPDWKWDW